MTRYMVIESFSPGARESVYQRFYRSGRMLPDGLQYIDSWLERDGDRCFQLMETDDPSLLWQWARCWDDLVAFEFVEIGEVPADREPPQCQRPPR